MRVLNWRMSCCVFCVFLLTFAFLPVSANAISTSNIANTNCSGSLTSSLQDGASFACTGNFTLDGGTVTSDSLINISATGDLLLDNLIFTAPNITFSVLSGMMTIGSGVVINSNSIILAGDTAITITKGALINLLLGSNNNIVAGKGFPLGGGGAGILSAGDGGGLNLGAGSGNVLVLVGNLPLTGGTLVLGSGGFLTMGGNPNSPAVVLSAVPELSTYAMMLLGVLGLAGIRRKSTQAAKSHKSFLLAQAFPKCL